MSFVRNLLIFLTNASCPRTSFAQSSLFFLPSEPDSMISFLLQLVVIECKSNDGNVKGRVIYFLGMGANLGTTRTWNVKHDYDWLLACVHRQLIKTWKLWLKLARKSNVLRKCDFSLIVLMQEVDWRHRLGNTSTKALCS